MLDAQTVLNYYFAKVNIKTKRLILMLEGVAKEESKITRYTCWAIQIINANTSDGKDLTLTAGYSKALKPAVAAAGEAATSDIQADGREITTEKNKNIDIWGEES